MLSDTPPTDQRFIPYPDEDEEDVEMYVEDIHDLCMELCQDLVSLEETIDVDIINKVYRHLHSIKGAAAILEFHSTVSLAHSAESLLSNIKEKPWTISAEIISSLLKAVDLFREILESLQTNRYEGGSDIDTAVNKINDLSYKVAQSSDKDVVIKDNTLVPVTELAQKEPKKTRKDQYIRVRTQHFERLKDINSGLRSLHELIQMIGKDFSYDQLLGVAQLVDSMSRQISEEIELTRMVSLTELWSNYPRIIRDLAVQCNKEVKFVSDDSVLLVYRNMIDELKDPMIHLLRNAMDHGLETVNERLAMGKAAHGTIEIKAFHDNEQVEITLCDDGRGIVPSKIKAKALEKGLAEEATLEAMDDKELLQLIFLPGFSTAKGITNLSGRGVGMDIVRTQIENMDGGISIESRPGKGCTFTIMLPMPKIGDDEGRDTNAPELF